LINVLKTTITLVLSQLVALVFLFFWKFAPVSGKLYKSQDKTEEYTKDEILALSSETVIYIGMNM